MSIKKKVVLAAMVIPLALGSVNVMAKAGGKHQKQCGGFHDKALRHVDLSEQQKTQLKALRDAQKQDRRSHADEHDQQRKDFLAQENTLINADQFDAAAATQLAQSMVEQQVEKRVANMKMHHDMLSVLTAEQRATLAEKQAQRTEKCEMKQEKRKEKRQAKKDDQ